MKKQTSDRIKALHFASQIVGRRILTGAFASFFLGNGYEVHSARRYSIEDDGKAIDWNVSARMNAPFVKTYKQEKNINIFLCIDFSRSMDSSYNGIMLKDLAKDIAYIFLLFSLHNGIPAGCMCFDANNFNISLPSTSQTCIFNMIEKIEEGFAIDEDEARGTPLNEAIKKMQAFLPSRSFVFLLSDFNVTGYKKPLSVLSCRHNVVAIRLINNSCFGLEKMGTVLFHDYESSFSSILNTSDKISAERRKNEFMRELAEWKQFCFASRVHPLLLNSNDDIVSSLSHFFASYKTYS